MPYELAKELKEAGFPQDPDNPQVHTAICGNFDNPDPECREENRGVRPTLSELIEACEPKWFVVARSPDEDPCWVASGGQDADKRGFGHTPEEAVARLWLALRNK